MSVSPLSGHIALVTGAARRLGRAVAQTLASAGVHVVVHYRASADAAERLAADLAARGVRAWPLAADLEDPAQADALLDRAEEAAGPVAILVNNASIFPSGALQDLEAGELRRNVQVNAFAPFQLGRALARRGRSASIVNMLDARITAADPGHAAYHLSKRMLFTLTRLMALEFAPAIRVNAVAPGLILPPEGKDTAYLDRLAARLPLRRRGAPEPVAAAVRFLLENDYITGQVIFVDGGAHLCGALYGGT
ncbi:MAG: SDR family oxidoreductase [Lentisphaerae bacterium]|nr:SDR family oxidoreductase [Lentisphaerota bacterium]